ncbi:CbaC protein [Natronobeatus ordinarius]|uniref:CbaC protein n=1 Tax=Natronobeatus ordinarius TaxID=2963433 RepID=UPI0020CD64C7|nr:CbaC protein [Natronobeatus ordinarius]
MRISPGVLVVLIGIAIPVIIELRTLLELFEIYVSVEATILTTGLVIAAIVLWAMLPEDDATDRSRTA